MFFCFYSFRKTSKKDPLFVCVAVRGSGKGHNLANNKITLDQITSALVVNDTKKFGAPPEPRTPILSNVRGAAKVKLTRRQLMLISHSLL